MNTAVAHGKLQVRLYQPGDVAVLARLFTDTVRTVNARDYSPEQIEAWAPDPPDLEHWGKRLQGFTVFTAEQDSRIVGFVTVASNGHLDQLYVHHRFLRRGIASALCRRLEQEALSHGIKRIFTEASMTARPFFESAGFQMVAPQTVRLRGMRFQNYRMEKILSGIRAE